MQLHQQNNRVDGGFLSDPGQPVHLVCGRHLPSEVPEPYPSQACVSVAASPGTLRIYSKRDFLHYSAQLHLTNHDTGLQESLAQLRLVNRGHVELVVIGVIPERCDFGEHISATVLEASFAAAERIRHLLVERGFDCRKRADRVQPRLWWMSESSNGADRVH